jgi:transposase InsO family protein
MMREGFVIARCTVERLMHVMGLAGVIRSKAVRTTISDQAAPCPRDHVNRGSSGPPEQVLGVRLHLCRDLGVVLFPIIHGRIWQCANIDTT